MLDVPFRTLGTHGGCHNDHAARKAGNSFQSTEKAVGPAA